jgi:hypothetical protein
VDLSPSDQDQISGTALNQAIPNQGTAPRNPPRLKGKFPLRWPAHSAKERATRDPRDPLGMCQGKRGRRETRLTCGLRALTAPRAHTRHCHSVSNGNERAGTLATRRCGECHDRTI